ncbi:MAG: hypothetical protein C5B50_23330 [Verrucomicrobia bacterium]|nr:MAG: hypothetical protein C5B50_23330 [Verrucomicrobiota bacterium]
MGDMKRPGEARLLLVAGLTFLLAAWYAPGERYDLAKVEGIQGFQGSAAAKELLARNGLVVSDPTFLQIFEAYIKSPHVEAPSEKNPRGTVLPSFITPDSAWHTYHVLLEEAVKEMEEAQAIRLREFSRQLLTGTKRDGQKAGEAADYLKLFVSVGLALQDAQHRKSLAGEEKRIVDSLRSTGSGPIEAGIGFPLSPSQFRAESFYTQSPELSDYFAARQWYGTVVFRLNNTRETRAALALAALINRNPELLDLWKKLSEPFDMLLAHAEDGTIREFAAAAAGAVGTNGDSISASQLAEIQNRLAKQLPLPRISDQFLQPEQYAQFGKEARGFRLLPPRQLPCSICFHNTTDPNIPGRSYPSGLDFLAASPQLRSPAAVRALESQCGAKVAELVLKSECGPMPDSLHGQAMRLLAKLQDPLPKQVAPALRTEAWQDLQLWTQLGAWAEQRHTWALHAKLAVSYAGIIEPPNGIVAPYPEFFSGLARLARQTADALEKAGAERQFEVRPVAQRLLEQIRLSQKHAGRVEEREITLEQMVQFENRYYEKHQTEFGKRDPYEAYRQMEKELEALARRCAETGQATQEETQTLRMFFDCRVDSARLMRDFPPVCERLAELAKKCLNSEKLSADDAHWIENYGVTLASFHFYSGNSYEVPRDDFPIVARVFSNPRRDSMLYAGLARPQALYVIVPNGHSLQLYRGAVMTYREFIRPNDQLLDDSSWREMIAHGQTPPAPPFTKSFCAETSVPDLLKRLRGQGKNEEANYGDIQDLLWQISSRATEKDLPELMEVMLHETGEERADIVDGLGEIIARLPWEPYQKRFIALLASRDNILAHASARVLVSGPGKADTTALLSAFGKQSSRGRRLSCVILSRLPEQTDAIRKTLLEALNDPADGVRWQAALAIGKAPWNDAQSRSALLQRLNDTNEIVGAAAAYSLAKLGATNAAPALLAKLKERLQSPPRVSEELSPQVMAIVQDTRGEENHADPLLDVDNLTGRLEMTVTRIMQRRAGMRVPPMQVNFPTHNYNLADALIEALGVLGYGPATDELFKLRGTEYEAQATQALARLEPDRLASQLLATARDKQVDSYLRERALLTLGELMATNRVHDLVPLLDDTTPIEYSRPLPGPTWRVCDRAAQTMAILLGWQRRLMPAFRRPEQMEDLLTRAREWAKATKR